LIADAAPEKTTAEWLALMKERDIPAGKVNNLEDLFTEPHLAAVNLFEAYEHPSEGAALRVRSAFRIEGLERKPDLPAPDTGGDGEIILREAGYSASDVQTLKQRRIIL